MDRLSCGVALKKPGKVFKKPVETNQQIFYSGKLHLQAVGVLLESYVESTGKVPEGMEDLAIEWGYKKLDISIPIWYKTHVEEKSLSEDYSSAHSTSNSEEKEDIMDTNKNETKTEGQQGQQQQQQGQQQQGQGEAKKPGLWSRFTAKTKHVWNQTMNTAHDHRGSVGLVAGAAAVYGGMKAYEKYQDYKGNKTPEAAS